MMKQRLLNGTSFLLLPFAALAQTAPGHHLTFEVSTIKPSATDEQPSVNFTLGPGDTYAETGGRFDTKGISLLDYIRFAYKLSDGQVEILQSKAPDWISSERFDIRAKSSIEHPTKDDMRDMMQSLLADRFALRTHAETRIIPVLALLLVSREPQAHHSIFTNLQIRYAWKRPLILPVLQSDKQQISAAGFAALVYQVLQAVYNLVALQSA